MQLFRYLFIMTSLFHQNFKIRSFEAWILVLTVLTKKKFRLRNLQFLRFPVVFSNWSGNKFFTYNHVAPIVSYYDVLWAKKLTLNQFINIVLLARKVPPKPFRGCEYFSLFGFADGANQLEFDFDASMSVLTIRKPGMNAGADWTVTLQWPPETEDENRKRAN